MKRIASKLVLASSALILFAFSASAQSQEQSLADAAKKAQAQKKQGKAPAREWNNDNISGPIVTTGASTGGGQWQTVRETGERVASAGGSATSGAASGGEVSEEDEKKRSDAEKDVADATKTLETLKNDLTLLKRDFGLKQQQVYSSADAGAQAAGKPALDQLNSLMQAKQTAVADAEKKLEEAKKKLEEINQQLGPKKTTAVTDPSQQPVWAGKIKALRDELAGVEAEITKVRSEQVGTANNSNAQPPPLLTGIVSADQTSVGRLGDLEKKRNDVRKKISDLQEEARRAGVPPDWIR